MKHLFTLILLLSFAGIVNSQTMFDSFDTPIESNYWVINGGLSDSSIFSYYVQTSGIHLLKYKYKLCLCINFILVLLCDGMYIVYMYVFVLSC